MSCDSPREPVAPPPPDPDLARVVIDVFPDWVDAPWILSCVADRYEGVGDSTVVVSRAGTYALYGGAAENLWCSPWPGPQHGEVALGDSLAFRLEYSQVPWQRTESLPGLGAWNDVLALDDGGALVCGNQDNQPRVARLDHDGVVSWSITEPRIGSYFRIIATDTASIVVAGSGNGTLILSACDLRGQGIWANEVDLGTYASFSGLIPDGTGGYLLLATADGGEGDIYLILANLGPRGELLGQSVLDGPGLEIGNGLARGPGGDVFVHQARQLVAGNPECGIEILVVDALGVLKRTIPLGNGEPELGNSLLGCRDGGVLVTYLAHDLDDELGSTEVAKITADGQIQWRTSLNAPGFEHLTACGESSEGRFLLVGNAFSYVPVDNQCRFVELDESGSVIRDKEVSTANTYTSLRAATVAWDGGLFAVGIFGHWDSGSSVAWAVRTDDNWGIPW